jgi:hypothetical protein
VLWIFTSPVHCRLATSASTASLTATVEQLQRQVRRLRKQVKEAD